MQDKKTYRIDENALREKFLTYQVNFNPACLEILENEVAQVKTHAHLELPETKKIVRFIAIPVVLVVLGFAAFFTYTYITNLAPATPVKDTATVSKPVIERKIEKQPILEAKPAVVPDSSKLETTKRDTSLETSTTNVKTSPKIVHTQKITKKDTASAVKLKTSTVDTIKKKTKSDTSSVIKNKETGGKKKKKKRKNVLDATDDIRQSEPDKADDDVIIPQ